jgi:hypothetical protein
MNEEPGFDPAFLTTGSTLNDQPPNFFLVDFT